LCCLGIIMMLNTFYSITYAQVTKEPSVSITADITSGTPPLAVSFTSTINDPFAGKYPITYEWYFDDGAASTKQNPKHTFTDPGEYHVICRVSFWKSPKVTVEAAVNIKVEKKVEPIPICTADNIQKDPQIISDGSGGAIITWEDLRSGKSDIYAQRIDNTGKILWTANGTVICTAAGYHQRPQITTDTSGGAIITWQDTRSGNYDIYAQRIDSTGKIHWTADGTLIVSANGNQSNPEITSDGSGGAVIVWIDVRSGNSWDIYAQRIDGTGKPQWTGNGVAVCTAPASQLYLQITSGGSGDVLITWQDNRSSNNDIYAQRVDSAGKPLWTADGVAICTAANNQPYPQIIHDGSGGAVITWEDFRNGAPDIYAQRIDSTGKILWISDGAAICTAASNQQNPQIISDGSSGVIMTWQDARGGTANWDIYAQRVDSTGKSLWTSDGMAVCAVYSHQIGSQIIPDGSGGAVITWLEHRNGSGTNSDIYAQRIDSTGKLLWPVDGMPVCKEPNRQRYNQMISDGSGGAIIVWQEQIDSANEDIYAQRITKDGEVK
jgi:PKD repeat protein